MSDSKQQPLRHSLTLPAGFHGSLKRYSTPNLTREALRNMDAYEGPVPLMKAFSSVPHEGLSARNPVWMEIQSALIGAFKGRANPSLGRTAQLVRSLGKTVSAGVVFDYLEKSLLKKGFKILCRRLDRSSEDPDELLESLESVWRFFHGQLVTEVKCVFQPMGIDLLSLDRVLMLGFRDQVLLPNGVHEILRSEAACGRGCSLSPGLTQMLLVLQMHRDGEPPSESDVALERMVALTVRPYIGFLGVYDGSEEPVHRANVSELVKTRRRLTRRAYISRNSLFRGADGDSGDAESLAIVVADDESGYQEDKGSSSTVGGERKRWEVGSTTATELEATEEVSEEDVDDGDDDWLMRDRFSSEPKADTGAVIFV